MSITSPSGSPRLDSPRPTPPRRKWFADLVWVTAFFVFVLIVENILVILWAVTIGAAGEGRTYTKYGVYSIAMLCSAAASFVGGLVGFLFGVPISGAVVERSARLVGAAQTDSSQTDSSQTDQPGSGPQLGQTEQATSRAATVTERQAARGSGLHANTNLESISDGLTKGLLAIGASQFLNIGGWAGRLADVLGPSLGPGNDGRVVAVSVVTYGAIAGLLFGYLATRIYLTQVFAEHDPPPM